MFQRKRTGSTLCPSCGKLVGVNDEVCWNCGRRNPGMWGLTSVFRRLGRDLGFVQGVIVGTAFLYIAMLVVDPSGIRMGGLLSIGMPSQDSLLRFGAAGRYPVWVYGRWWTVLSAGWLHAGLLHIGFNLYWIRILAPETAELYGAGRMVVIYTISSIVGFLVSSSVGLLLPFFSGALLTVGASAPILGLLGALVHYGRRTGSSIVGRQAWSYALFMIVFGFLMRGVDNWAHLGGFAGGYLASMMVDPRRPERGNDLVLALVCLVLTAASIVASLVIPVPG
ncbi:MAG TPA: rhomboid family intramembrane serine protease [Thermoanaerobaculia bacterium]|jgi:rhomboid protease GluP|nr:rhomboid family intramembrane serine protease [Thermoanaerobaculia bacterium]